jgi:hypothetical protein
MREYQIWFLGSVPGKVFLKPVAMPYEGKCVLEALHSFVSFINGDAAVHFGGLQCKDAVDSEWVEWKDLEGNDVWTHGYDRE